ncbi:MAG: caspase family protein [Acidobacteriota bacterium]
MKKYFPLILLLLFSYSLYSSTTSKFALVIGNSKYKNSPLKNPKNDASDISAILKEKGFEVKLVVNASHKKMVTAIRKFGKKLYSGGIGLFYYAGHGVQVKGRNYLIPVNADIEDEDDVEFNAVDAGFVLSKMESAENTMNIIILDACRDNPFARSFRSSSRGLARMDAPKGSIIIYATSPGSVAADGDSRNGVFTKHLLRLMRESTMEIASLLREVRRSVMRETEGRQLPWESSSLMSDFYFTPDKVISTPEKTKPAVKKKESKVLPPKEVSIDFSDIETEKKWRKWQSDFNDSVKKARSYEKEKLVSRQSKKSAWERIKNAFDLDNPFSKEDEKLKGYVAERIDFFNKPAGTGFIEVSAYPYAELIIDGKSYGEIPPLKKVTLTEGPHVLIFKKGNKQKTKKVVVKKGETGFYYHDF